MAMSPDRLQHLLSWLAPIVLAGLLLFPSTCADAAGVHSLFDDPLAHDAGHQQLSTLARYAELYGMSVDELNLHVSMGHVTLPNWVTDSSATRQSPETERDPCPPPPGFRNMPATMGMDSATAVVVVIELDVIDAPVTGEATICHVVQVPTGHIGDLDSPPPRAIV